MSTPFTTDPPEDLFTTWLHQTNARTRIRGPPLRPEPQGRLRFAFYGRMSTIGYQDPTTSRQWQHDNAAVVIAGHGIIVAKYFDAGYSRSLPWHQRPAPGQLLHEAARPDRQFDAIVIGEYERTSPRLVLPRCAEGQDGICGWFESLGLSAIRLRSPSTRVVGDRPGGHWIYQRQGRPASRR